MTQATLLLAIGTGAILAILLTVNYTLGRTRARLQLAVKRTTAGLVPVALAGSVVTQPTFYTARPALLLYMAAPAVIGLIWTAYKIEAAAPGRITGLVRGNQRTRRTGMRQRNPRIVPGFLRSLRGWLTLAIFEDTPVYRIVHIAAITAGGVAAATFPTPPAYFAPFLIVAVSTIRWMKVQGTRSKIIARVYAIAAAHLDYSRAVNSKFASGGAQFASATGAINVEWTDLTNPTRITIAFPVTFAKTNLEKRNTFEDEFDATLPGAGWKFDWDTTATTVTVTVATYSDNVRWEMRTPEKWSQFYVGDQLDDGTQVTFDLESESPHCIVAGETGSGKTEAMFVIAAQALQKGWDVAICDPKETGWAMWTRRRRPTNEAGHDTGAAKLRPGDGRPGVVEHAVELYGIRDVLARCVEEMQRRKKVNGANKVVKWTELSDEVKEAENIKPLMVVVDEALSLFDMEKGGTDEIKERNDVRGQSLGLLQKLIVEARALGIHVLLGIQRPDAAVLGGAMRSNLGARIACGVMEPSGYQMMFQVQSGVPRLVVNGPDGKKVIGRALVRSSPGQPIVPVQVAWLGKGQKDLEDVAPMPAEPEQEDETPTGPFNPYAQFDDPSPWLRDGGSTSDTAAPQWETLAPTPAPAAVSETPPWEQMETPPWEVGAPASDALWQTSSSSGGAASTTDDPPWEFDAPQAAAPKGAPQAMAAPAAPAGEAPPWEQLETPPWEQVDTPPWEASAPADRPTRREVEPDDSEDLASLMTQPPQPGRDRPAKPRRAVRPEAPAAGTPLTAPATGDAWLTPAPAWEHTEPATTAPPSGPAPTSRALPEPVEQQEPDASEDEDQWWG